MNPAPYDKIAAIPTLLHGVHSTQSYHCRNCGYYDGDSGFSIPAYERVNAIWARAGNVVQWNPSKKTPGES